MTASVDEKKYTLVCGGCHHGLATPRACSFACTIGLENVSTDSHHAVEGRLRGL